MDAESAFNYDTAGSVITLTSTSIEDGVAGTGIRSIVLEGLNTDWDVINEVVILTGTTAVATTNTFLRLNSALILTMGSTGKSVGVITGTGDSFTWIKLAAAQTNIGNFGRFSVARNHSFTAENFGWSSGLSGDCVLN